MYKKTAKSRGVIFYTTRYSNLLRELRRSNLQYLGGVALFEMTSNELCSYTGILEIEEIATLARGVTLL